MKKKHAYSEFAIPIIMYVDTKNYGYSKVNLLVSRTSHYPIFTEKVLNELKSH